jgi:hypothetical protein
VSRGAAAVALTCVALLAAAGGAGAATLRSDRMCYATGDTIALGGSGFMPNVNVALPGAMSPTTDPFGRLQTTALAPRAGRFLPRTVRFEATDPTGLMATVDVLVVRHRFETNLPLAGRPRTRTWWRFAGFEPGRPIFGHFRTGGRTVRTFRFGVPHDACGVLSVRAPRLPVASPRPGVWRLKLDQEATYRRKAPGRIISFRVSPG